jgi:phosphate transport system permease protein
VGLNLLVLIWTSQKSLETYGWHFLIGTTWDPIHQIFGAAPYIYGTLVSALIAIGVATPLGIGTALFLTEFSPHFLRGPISFLIEILAAIPSVVFGLWGIFLLAPFLRDHIDPYLIHWIGPPLFRLPSTGPSLFTAGIILAIMILPTISAISREVFESIPNSYRESARALGATSWETIHLAVLKPAQSGIWGAIILALGRALGETMAVTMIIGNRPKISANLLQPSHSMASVIANEFTEAMGTRYLSALTEIGLLLLIITLLINIMANALVWITTRKFSIHERI